MNATTQAIARAESIAATKNAKAEVPLMRFTSSRQAKTDQFSSTYADTDARKIMLAGAIQMLESGTDANNVIATLAMAFEGATAETHIVEILGYDRKWFATLQKMGGKEIRNVAVPKIRYAQIKVLEFVLGEAPEPEHDFFEFGSDLELMIKNFVDASNVPITVQFQKKLSALVKAARKMGDGDEALPRMFIVQVEGGNVATANVFSGQKVVFAPSIDTLEDHLSCVKHDNPNYENSLETARNKWLKTQTQPEPDSEEE